VTVRVRFADLNSATRSATLDAPISATLILADLAEDLVRAVLADHPDEKTISLLAISVSHLEEHWDLELELPLGLQDEARRPGTKMGMARWTADCAVDKIRDRRCWVFLVPCPTSFANSRKRTCNRCRSGVTQTAHFVAAAAQAALIQDWLCRHYQVGQVSRKPNRRWWGLGVGHG
jgi:hypothetical protein